MIFIKNSLPAALLAVVTITIGSGSAANSAVNSRNPFVSPPGKQLRKYVQGEVLVKFKNRIPYSARLTTISRRGGTRLQELGGTSIMRIGVREGQSIESTIANYKADPSVEYAQPNYIYRANAAPNDTRYGELWSLHNTGQTVSTPSYLDENDNPINNPGTSGLDMNMENAWDVITDCSTVVVAVIDSGVNYNQEDLIANMWNGSAAGYPNHGYDFVDTDNDPMDYNGHGTHIAGIVGSVGNNGTGTTGVCWNVKIMAIRVLDTTCSGTTASILNGLNFAVQHGAKVINMSLGGAANDTALSNAITAAQTAGVLVVVSAGNNAFNIDSGVPNEANYPCNYTQDNVICVAALDQSFELAYFSNYGSTSVNVGAPGVNNWSTWPGTFSEISDDFNTAGALDWTIWGDDNWAYQNINGNDLLTNPKNWDGYSSKYEASMSTWAYKQFGSVAKNADAVTINFSLNLDVKQYDTFYLNHYTNANHFKQIESLTNFTTEGYFLPLLYDISSIAAGMDDCDFYFEFYSNPSDQGYGVAIADFILKTFTINSTSYEIIDGTSMASPHVAGLAAMLFAFNPEFTYHDVAKSILECGNAVAALEGKTTAGKSVDAFKSICRIDAPTGVSIVMQ